MTVPYQKPLDNPYNSRVPSYRPQTPPMEALLGNAIDSALLELHTWSPAQVAAVHGNQKVDIQLLLQRRYINDPSNPANDSGKVVTLPVIKDVIVSMPMGSNYFIKLPVAVGDTGIALFCERSLDVWQVQGGLVDPQDSRHHNLSDPVFIPGLYPFNQQTQDTTTDLVVSNGEAEIRVLDSGKFKIQNEAQELISNLYDLVTTLISATTVTGGPFVPSVVAELTSIAANLATLKG